MTAHSPSSGRRVSDKAERILAAAERVFAKRGFYHARVSEIARDAGVADGTIYLYFKNKDDLLISLFESRMERVNEELAAAVAEGADARAKLERFIQRYVQLVADNPHVAEVITVELRQSSKFMKEYDNPRFAELMRMLTAVIAGGQSEGTLDPQFPPHLAARVLFGALDELTLAWVLGGGEKFDIVRAADWLSALTLRGLERRSDS